MKFEKLLFIEIIVIQWGLTLTTLGVIKVNQLLHWLDYKEGKEAFQSEG